MRSELVISLLQMLILLLSALIAMGVGWRSRSHGLLNGIALIALLLTLIVYLLIPVGGLEETTPLLILDNYTRFFGMLILLSAFVVAVLAYSYFGPQHPQMGAFYSLLLLSTLGALILAGSRHFLSFFAGMELFSLCLYTMITYIVPRNKSTALIGLEAGVKYLSSSAVATAILLFGMALVYLQTGTLVFTELPGRINDEQLLIDPLVALGILMMLSGLCFKLSVVPFHLWTADVYEGAPAPVTTFMATVAKVAILAVMLRVLLLSQIYQYEILVLVMTMLAAASMLAGNLLAIRQRNLKRLLAYASIAHLGHVMLLLVAASRINSPFIIEALGFFIAAYVLASLAVFGLLSMCSSQSGERTALEDYRGLLWQQPWLALGLIVALFSLAGMPLTMGFMAKFYVLSAAVEGAMWLLLALFITSIGLGLYYTLRVTQVLIAEPASTPTLQHQSGREVAVVMTVLSVLLLALGVYPQPLIEFLYHVAAEF